MLGFRTRNPLRDRQTDETRLERLRRTLTEIADELEKEKAGFQARYERASSDALITYSNRIAALDRQLAFMAQLGVEVAEFAIAEADAREATP